MVSRVFFLTAIFLQFNINLSGQITIQENGNLDVDGGKIRDVGPPTLDQDATTKAYVDNLLLTFGISLGHTGVQGLLDGGFTINEIIAGGANSSDFYGVMYEGGIIFHITPEGTGLVSAPVDQGDIIKWALTAVITGASGFGIGTGQANTDSILFYNGAGNYAAYLCDTLTLNGFDDWFLPSSGELTAMWEHLADADGDSDNSGQFDPGNLGNFEPVRYWCSSEATASVAWTVNMGTGVISGFPKLFDFYNVRAVRAF